MKIIYVITKPIQDRIFFHQKICETEGVYYFKPDFVTDLASLGTHSFKVSEVVLRKFFEKMLII